MPLLEIKNLRKKFGGLAAVHDLDLEVNEGEIRGIIGPNGSGKSTLFNLISGFYQPTKGKVFYRGEDITGLRPSVIAKRGIARTFQLTSLYNAFTVQQNVVAASYLHAGVGFFGAALNTPSTVDRERKIEEKALEVLTSMGLADYKYQLADSLPQGLQRVLGICIALAIEPEVLMLDEPASGLSPAETTEMMHMIDSIRHRGVTILLVEHDMRVIMGLCDQITVIAFGKKIAEGAPKEVAENKDVIEAYLGTEEEYVA